jgi:hypothetical protein
MVDNEEYRRVTNDLFRVRLDKPSHVDVRWIPGSVLPARLVLALQDRPDLERVLVTPKRGAILEVDMTAEVAARVYEQIWQLAQTAGLPLPKLDKSQA